MVCVCMRYICISWSLIQHISYTSQAWLSYTGEKKKSKQKNKKEKRGEIGEEKEDDNEEEDDNEDIDEDDEDIDEDDEEGEGWVVKPASSLVCYGRDGRYERFCGIDDWFPCFSHSRIHLSLSHTHTQLYSSYGKSERQKLFENYLWCVQRASCFLSFSFFFSSSSSSVCV